MNTSTGNEARPHTGNDELEHDTLTLVERLYYLNTTDNTQHTDKRRARHNQHGAARPVGHKSCMTNGGGNVG